MLSIIIVIFKTDKQKLQLVLDKINKNLPIIFIVNDPNYNFDGLIILQKHTFLKSENDGNGAAINLALKTIKTEYAIYLDIDIFFELNFFEEMINAANIIRDFSILVPNHGNLNSKNDILEKYDGEASVIFFNMSKLEKIGHFDQNFFLYYEETDLLLRCKNINEKVYFLPKIRIKHFRASSIVDETNEIHNLRSWHYMWSMFYFYRKNYSYFYALKKTYKLLFYDFIKLILFIVCFNSKSFVTRYYRIWGLVSSMLFMRSFLRPNLNKN